MGYPCLVSVSSRQPDSAFLKSGPKWASKLGAAVKRTASVVKLSRPTAASAVKERDSDAVSIQTTASRESVAVSSRPGTPSAEHNGKASKLGAASMCSHASPTAASAAKDSNGAPAPVHKSVSPTPKPTLSPKASRRPAAPSSGEAPSLPRALEKADSVEGGRHGAPLLAARHSTPCHSGQGGLRAARLHIGRGWRSLR